MPTPADGPALAAALEYAARGWHVFPCRAGEKIPATAHGFKDATTDPETIRAWWTASPSANVAMPTGKVSGLAVLDIDPRNDGDLEWQMLVAQIGEPVAPRVRTPSGGTHLYFACPAAGLASRVGLKPGIDLKADGGYVLAPPSIVFGNPYTHEA